MFEIPDLGNPLWFAVVSIIVFVVVLTRYIIAAGLFHLVFYVWYPKRFLQRKLSPKPYSKQQFRKELSWSLVTAFIFGVVGALGILAWQRGYMQVYLDAREHPLWWIPLSLVVALLLHETYYYWLHRVMHHKKVFRLVHKVHHESNITSPWTAFSFHPIEGLLQALFLPLLLVIMPMHLHVLIFQLTFMTITSVINHLDIEIYPSRFRHHFIAKWMIGATHHSLHHKQFKYNYGLYFTFWDKWSNTESPLFQKLFAEKTQVSKTTVNISEEEAMHSKTNPGAGCYQ